MEIEKGETKFSLGGWLSSENKHNFVGCFFFTFYING